jgi:Carboxypeptidase regulatory-like domain
MKDRKTIALILLFSAVLFCLPAVVYAETVAGTVYDGSDDAALEDVTVTAENDDQSAIASTTTNASGAFTLTSDDITAGDHTISFTITGYVTARGLFTITTDTNIGQVFLAPESAQTGTITGTLIDATSQTDATISDATITLYTGINHTDDAYETSYTTTTAADGTFELTDVDAGTYTLLAARTGFSDAYINVVSIGGQTTTYEHSLSPAAAEGEIRIVLTWGENPADLDSHLYTPEINGAVHHLYYANRGSYSVDASPNIALDRDDVTSYGPETVTIAVTYEGTYEYRVYHFSGSGTLAGTSGAIVKVYDSTGLLFTRNVPPSLSDPLWWDVFRYDGETRTFSTFTGVPIYGAGGGSGGSTDYINDKDDFSCFITSAAESLF